MGNPLDKLKKIKGKSWDELRTRGGQAFSVYSEQIGLSGKMPTDAEFAELIDKSFFGKSPIIAESLWVKFFKNGDDALFPFVRHVKRKPPSLSGTLRRKKRAGLSTRRQRSSTAASICSDI